MQETTAVRRRAPLRRVRPAGWWFDLLLLAAAAALTVALANGYLLDLDLAVRNWSETHRSDGAYRVALVLNVLGQGGWFLMPFAGALALVAGLRTRSVRPLVVVLTAFLLTYLTIGPMKLLLGRGFPRNELLAHPERLFSDPADGMAYPSGHVINAIVWYGVICLMLAALLRTAGRSVPPEAQLAVRVVPPAIVSVTTVYLGHHWATDSVAGLLLGLVLTRLLARVPWDDVPLPALPQGWDRPGVFGATT